MAALASVTSELGNPVSDQKGIAEALRSHWPPTFTAEHSSLPASQAGTFLSEWVPRWHLRDLRPPSLEDIEGRVRVAKNSAPGLDGLPNGAWRAGGETAAITLLLLTHECSCDTTLPGLNEQRMVFPPGHPGA